MKIDIEYPYLCKDRDRHGNVRFHFRRKGHKKGTHQGLVNFWTYSCINRLRTLPHVRAWAAAYKGQGLVVVGVHTPEFAFEKDIANVTKAATALGVSHPVAIDNSFGIWRAFHNSAWPALYLFGADGRLRQTAFGEGGYEFDRDEASGRGDRRVPPARLRGHLARDARARDGRRPGEPPTTAPPGSDMPSQRPRSTSPDALNGKPRAIDGIEATINRVVRDACKAASASTHLRVPLQPS